MHVGVMPTGRDSEMAMTDNNDGWWLIARQRDDEGTVQQRQPLTAICGDDMRVNKNI